MDSFELLNKLDEYDKARAHLDAEYKKFQECTEKSRKKIAEVETDIRCIIEKILVEKHPEWRDCSIDMPFDFHHGGELIIEVWDSSHSYGFSDIAIAATYRIPLPNIPRIVSMEIDIEEFNHKN